jgi:hypothetical protein
MELLELAKGRGETPDANLLKWLGAMPDKLRARFVRAKLAEPRRQAGGMTFGAFIDAFLAGRPDFKPFTVTNFKQVKRWALSHFGDRQLHTITAADAENFRQHMIDGGLGENAIRRNMLP